ncbi:unnamed protein product [Penicillium salamii]|uniref:NAD(P)-binding protein n=1 Tax=Penicillium salamii TaxID=1612424 RepID=A0A9W4I8E1_9EURO|nr:unnamed protein product [Penicillium salamii]CAG8259126.1 unnamed protein product [Penicillium salamii]CAG8389836.1 unnamed protein product [Penicillium salamii]CAG8427030.1 unnamed protein product [Penicillium salamii]
MPSYLVTGASRGLGFDFIRQLAQNPTNTVIGLVRDKAAAEKKVLEEGLSNVHIVKAQYIDYSSLKRAAEEVKEITGGGLDHLINNAAVVSHISEFKTFKDFDHDFETLEKDLLESLEINLLAVIKTVQAFIPLIRQGKQKKVLSISTGMADLDLINATEVDFAAPYAISKGALNVTVAKYNALYKKEGILFLAVSPGYVATERNQVEPAKEDADKVAVLVQKFVEYAPHFERPLAPAESVSAVLSVLEKSSIANGDGGAFISHLGNKQWL